MVSSCPPAAPVLKKQTKKQHKRALLDAPMVDKGFSRVPLQWTKLKASQPSACG